MGLRKRCLTAGLVVLATLCFAPSALAWTFSTSGAAICDTSTGEQVITWTIDNRTEPETLTIRQSSRAAVAVGSTVPARSIRQFAERLAGGTVGTVALTVKGNWPSDTYLRTRSALVTLTSACVRDQCPNLAGVQEQVPSGMTKSEAGHCVPPAPTDVCPNLAGVQEEVPAGMVKDSSGDCITPPTDVCPNIEGLQTALPEGFAKEESGDCVYPPRVVTVTVETILEKTIEKQIEVPGPERVVTLSASPSVVEKVVERVVTKVVIKKIKAAAKKKAKRKKPKAIRPRVLPFTP